jgi:hypothetical protein
MGTKNNPGAFDCYANAEPDEPMFVLLARDLAAPEAITAWCAERVRLGLNAPNDAQLTEALDCAEAMEKYAARFSRKDS